MVPRTIDQTQRIQLAREKTTNLPIQKGINPLHSMYAFPRIGSGYGSKISFHNKLFQQELNISFKKKIDTSFNGKQHQSP
jgi:hypothetical protein